MNGGQTILFAGGGTGGHLYPGIAVAQALRCAMPDARPLFLCTNRPIDRTILEAAGMEFIAQPIVPPQRTISGLLRFWRSWRETKDLVRRTLRERRPAAVLGLGGYAAGVAVKIAALRKVPTALLNQDVLPGKANRYLMRFAKAICCQFESTADHLPRHHRMKLHFTGCPIRQELRQLPAKPEAAKRLGLDPLLNTLVITGASQGAQTVNEAAIAALRDMPLQGWQVLHLAGTEHADAVRSAYREASIAARVIDFTPAMSDAWSVADLAISRAGASTCAELAACGVASILMPYPYHKDMHQRANAQVLASAGAAELLDDEKDATRNAQKLRPLVQSLLYDSPCREAMAAAARSLGKPAAAEQVADILANLAGAR